MSNEFYFYGNSREKMDPINGPLSPLSHSENQEIVIVPPGSPIAPFEISSSSNQQRITPAVPNIIPNIQGIFSEDNYLDPDVLNRQTVTYPKSKIIAVRRHLDAISKLPIFLNRDLVITILVSDIFGILSWISSAQNLWFFNHLLGLLIVILLLSIYLTGALASNTTASKVEAGSALELLSDPANCLLRSTTNNQ